MSWILKICFCIYSGLFVSQEYSTTYKIIPRLSPYIGRCPYLKDSDWDQAKSFEQDITYN